MDDDEKIAALEHLFDNDLPRRVSTKERLLVFIGMFFFCVASLILTFVILMDLYRLIWRN